MTQDRGAEFYFDRHDVDETNYTLEATKVFSEFQRTQVIPEIDAYRYSNIASLAIDKNIAVTETLTTDNILKSFLKSVVDIQDRTGLGNDNFVATMPYTVYEILISNEKISKMTDVTNFKQGGLDFNIKTINGIPIIPVQSSRMKTAYIFGDGVTEFGFKDAPTAKVINWIITPKTTPIAVSKTDKVKIFSPEINQDGDGWKTQYRKYHDIWIPENRINGIAVSIKG